MARFNEAGRGGRTAKRMKSDLGIPLSRRKEPLDNEGKNQRIVSLSKTRISRRRAEFRLMAVGRYVLSAGIWAELERTEPGARGTHPAHQSTVSTNWQRREKNSRLTRC